MKGVMKRFLKGFYIVYLAAFVVGLLTLLIATLFLKKFELLSFWDIAEISNAVGGVFGFWGGLSNILEIKIRKE